MKFFLAIDSNFCEILKYIQGFREGRREIVHKGGEVLGAGGRFFMHIVMLAKRFVYSKIFHQMFCTQLIRIHTCIEIYSGVRFPNGCRRSYEQVGLLECII